MADPLSLTVRYVHVAAAMLWVGYLAVLALVLVPAARGDDEHTPNLGPLIQRLGPMRSLGPLVLLAGVGMVLVDGRPLDALWTTGWGHAVLGGLGIAVAMMGLEHGLALPRLEDAHKARGEARDEELATAQRAAGAAAVLGLVAALLMVLALQGGL
jgi:uncharacterized membrane protein